MSTHQENSTSSSSNSSYKHPPGFLHRANFRNDMRMVALRRAGGAEAYGIMLMLFEVLLESPGYRLSDSDVDDVAFGLNVDAAAAQRTVSAGLTSGLLCRDDIGAIFSPDILQDVSRYELKRAQCVEAGRKRQEKSKPEESERVPSAAAERTLSERSAEVSQRDGMECNALGSGSEKSSTEEIRSATTHAPASDEAPRDPLLADAEARLQAPGGQPWTQSNAWICAGRRPLKRFPLIFLTPQELIQALQQIRKSIPPDDVAGVFESCEARLRNKSPQQRDQVSAYNWLTGWCLEEAIDKATKRQRGKNSGVPVAPIARAQPQQATAPPPLAQSEPRVSDEKAKEYIEKLKEVTRCAKSIQ